MTNIQTCHCQKAKFSQHWSLIQQKKSLHTVKVFGKVVSAKSQTALYLEQNSNTQVGAIVFLWPTPYALCSVQRETGR
jgi:hypothetical protein